jgi:hypothetical protein
LWQVPLSDKGLRIEHKPEVRYGDKVYQNCTVIYGVTWRDNGAFDPQQATIPSFQHDASFNKGGSHPRKSFGRRQSSSGQAPVAPMVGSYAPIPELRMMK